MATFCHAHGFTSPLETSLMKASPTSSSVGRASSASRGTTGFAFQAQLCTLYSVIIPPEGEKMNPSITSLMILLQFETLHPERFPKRPFRLESFRPKVQCRVLFHLIFVVAAASFLFSSSANLLAWRWARFREIDFCSWRSLNQSMVFLR